MPYKILSDELQVLEALSAYRDPVTGEVNGYNHKANLWLKGEVVPDKKVSPVIKEALDNEDPEDPTYQHLQGKIEKVGSGQEQLDAARRLGLPFDDYDSLSEDEVVGALRVLSAPLVQSVKEYEAQNEGRSRILEYNVGTREAADDRLRGDAAIVSEAQPAATDKAAGEIQTREVSENDVVPGEGYTGSDPVREPGVAASKEGASEEESSTGSAESTRKPQRRRGGNRSKGSGNQGGGASS